jgi:hypothetical protein
MSAFDQRRSMLSNEVSLYTSNYFQCGEVKGKNQIIQEKIEEWRIDTIYIDSAAQQVKADFAYDYDISTTNAIKSVNDGINFVQTMVEHDKLLFDNDGGAHSFHAMASYKWNQTTDIPKPVHDWSSHACDAIRYAMYTHHKMSSISIYS